MRDSDRRTERQPELESDSNPAVKKPSWDSGAAADFLPRIRSVRQMLAASGLTFVRPPYFTGAVIMNVSDDIRIFTVLYTLVYWASSWSMRIRTSRWRLKAYQLFKTWNTWQDFHM